MFHDFLYLEPLSKKTLNILRVSLSGIPVWKDFEYFMIFSVWKYFEYFKIISVWSNVFYGVSVWGRSPETLNFFNPCLEFLPEKTLKFLHFSLPGIHVWNDLTFLSFLCLESLSEKTLKFLRFSLSGIHVRKDFEYFKFSPVWNPRLKRLWNF